MVLGIFMAFGKIRDMSRDRFITWADNAKRPSPEAVESALRRYIHQSGTVERVASWLCVVLPGEPRFVFREEEDEEPFAQGGCQQGERYIELFLDPESTYSILTRTADEFTNTVAYGTPHGRFMLKSV